MIDVSPYFVNGKGEALAGCVCDDVDKAVGCGMEAGSVGDDLRVLCSDKHDKRENANVIFNRKTLVRTFKSRLIKRLLADGILQHA